jgi:hypothetical protein
MFSSREHGAELLELRTAQEIVDRWITPESEMGNVR